MKKHAIFLLVLIGALAAQNWDVQLLPPPPEQFFAEQMWNCTVTNPEGEAVDVRLYGWITHEGDEIAHARSNAISIPAGTIRITSADIKSVEDEWYDPAYEDVAERRGALPAGVYTYCLRVEDESGLVLAEDCGEHRGVSPSPPKLMAPLDGSEVNDPYPTFVWTPPVPPPPEATYELRIVEVPEEMTPDEAISAAEPWFEQDGITATSFLYPMDARPLEENMEYAWQVSAWSGQFLVGTSDTWAFNLILGAIPRLDSCQCYYDKETGVMWHGIGGGGRTGVRKDSCTYVVTVDGKLYHADGRTWTVQEGMTVNDRCKLFLAKNGMFHFDGTKWVPAGEFHECNYVLAENGMFHFNGSGWDKVADSTCTYVYTVASSDQGRNRIMYHFNGEEWKQVSGKKCQLYVAINGLYHFDGTRWVKKTFRKCNAVFAENGMFHYNGSIWVKIADDSCTYVYTAATSGEGDTSIMYHYDGTKWNRVQETECEIYRAYNGMFHYNGKKWNEIKPEKCKGVLAENGMYHYNGTEWVRVRDDSCTYVFTSNSTGNGETPIMYHFDGYFWRPVRDMQRCQLYRAYNGMFHFGRKGWYKQEFKTCSHVLAENGMFHFNGESWDSIPRITCSHVYTVASTQEGKTPHVYHYNGREWRMVPEVRGTEIETIDRKTYRYDGRRWRRVR